MGILKPRGGTIVADILRLHDYEHASLTLECAGEARGIIRAEVVRGTIDEFPLRLLVAPSRMWGKLFITGLITDPLPDMPDIGLLMAWEATVSHIAWDDVGIDPRTGDAAYVLIVRAGELERALEHARRRLELLVPQLYEVVRMASGTDWCSEDDGDEDVESEQEAEDAAEAGREAEPGDDGEPERAAAPESGGGTGQAAEPGGGADAHEAGCTGCTSPGRSQSTGPARRALPAGAVHSNTSCD